jgi:hypothetical protein
MKACGQAKGVVKGEKSRKKVKYEVYRAQLAP